jgi:hypothetical protein
MSEGDAQAKPESEVPAKIEKPEPEPQPVASLPVPLVPPPETKLPFQFNQQINVYQIPQNAWDRLSASQIMDLTKMILAQADVVDKRHFDFAMGEAKRDDEGKKLSIKVGAGIALAAFIAAGLLALYGHELAAITISLPLATILAVIVGNRFLS